MPRLKTNPQTQTDNYFAMRSDEHYNETRDCAVFAVMHATGVNYPTAHAACAAHGRKDRQGMRTHHINDTIRSLGFLVTRIGAHTFIDRYPGAHKHLRHITTHHPHRFHTVWADGKTYLFYIRGHVCVVKNGTLTDWTHQYAKRVLHVYEVWRFKQLHEFAQ